MFPKRRKYLRANNSKFMTKTLRTKFLSKSKMNYFFQLDHRLLDY